jgi:hypothetical protein
MRRVRVVIDCKIIEHVKSLKYLGCSVSAHESNIDMQENIETYETRNVIKDAHCAFETSPYVLVWQRNMYAKKSRQEVDINT